MPRPRRPSTIGSAYRALCLLVLVAARAPAAEGRLWFEDLPPVSRHAPVTLLDLSHRVARTVVHGDAFAAPEAVGQPALVAISASDGRDPARVVVAIGPTLAGAAEAALGDVVRWRADGLRPRHVVVDVGDAVVPVDYREDGSLVLPAERWGVAYDAGSGVALLPAELTAGALVDARGRLRTDRVQARLAARRRTVAEVSPAWRFATRRFVSDGRHTEALDHGRPADWRASPPALLAAAAAAGQHLARAVGSDGRFVYAYDPVQDRVTSGYNMLRHAGTTYAMLELYEVARSAPLLAAATRALGYLRQRIVPCGSHDDERCLAERGEGKLGGNGLALVALAKHAQVTGKRADLPVMQGLARRIQALQRPDGRFAPHKVDLRSAAASSFVSEYYPGEAILGLLRLHALAPSAALVETAARGAAYLTDVRDGSLEPARLPHDHWLLYALDELDRVRPDAGFDASAGRIVEAILNAQRTLDRRGCCRTVRNGFVAAPAHWAGTFYTPPRSTPLATRVEGLAAAHALALRRGRAEDAARLRAAMVSAVGFGVRTQIGPETAMYLARPDLVVGAFRENLVGHRIRIDYAQHNISALLGLRRALLAAPPAGS
jgi:hypothetical protein